jgi:hypothetical protein
VENESLVVECNVGFHLAVVEDLLQG